MPSIDHQKNASKDCERCELENDYKEWLDSLANPVTYVCFAEYLQNRSHSQCSVEMNLIPPNSSEEFKMKIKIV